MTSTPTTLTPLEIEKALETLNSSMSYDAWDRWMPAYQTLRPLRGVLTRARRKYAWVVFIGIALMIAGLVAVFTNKTILSDGVVWLAFMPVLCVAVPDIAGAIADQLAKRDQPLLRWQSAIEGACSRFDKLINDRFDTSMDRADV